jgi:hypothetical protein
MLASFCFRIASFWRSLYRDHFIEIPCLKVCKKSLLMIPVILREYYHEVVTFIFNYLNEGSAILLHDITSFFCNCKGK